MLIMIDLELNDYKDPLRDVPPSTTPWLPRISQGSPEAPGGFHRKGCPRGRQYRGGRGVGQHVQDGGTPNGQMIVYLQF